jgi:histidinol-phosphatase (PHP family)
MHLRGPANDREGPIELTVDAVERFVEQAQARGVDEIGFTEHMYYFRQTEALLGHPYHRSRATHDLDDYCGAIVAAKERGLPVKLGLELEWLPGRDGELAEILEPYPWDYLLGSVHLIDGEAVDMEPGLWDELSVEEIWRRYFEALGDLAASGLADVLAHPDLVKIFGRRPPVETVEECHERAAAAIGAADVAVEVSTAGLRKPVRELYPAPALLEMAVDAGLPIALSSDAHTPDQLGFRYEDAVAALRDAGVTEICVFERRARRMEPLG